MATSFQSKVTGCAGVASAAGETKVGAAGVGGAEGFTVSAAVLVTPAKTAEMVAEDEVVTELVVILKLALLLPAVTVTLVGTLVALELSESVTTAPPAGAAAPKVTVPVEECPPTTLVGLRVSAEIIGVVVVLGVISKSA